MKKVLAALFCTAASFSAAADMGEAWNLFNDKQLEPALKIFGEVHAQTPSAESAEGLAYTLIGLGCTDEAKRVILTSSADREKQSDLLMALAWREFNDGHFAAARATAHNALRIIPASRPAPDTEKVFLMSADKMKENLTSQPAAKPGKDVCRWKPKTQKYFSNHTYAVYKDGGEGLAKFLKAASDFEFQTGRFFIAAAPVYARAGKPEDTYYKGSVYLGGAAKEIDYQYIMGTAALGYKTDKLKLWAGVSPVGGALAPVPNGGIFYKPGKFFLEVKSVPVENTLLSYSGLDDPYSEEAWGRVSDSGAKIGIDTTVFGLFFNIAGMASFLWGENTEDNFYYGGEAALGKYLAFQNSALSVGVFGAYKVYDNNQNWYSFGHGGYFSPQEFAVGGPFVNYEMRLTPTFSAVFNGSLPYSYEMTEETDIFHKTANAPAGKYEGETKSKLGQSARVELIKKLSDKTDLKFFAEFNNSAEYKEYAAGINFNRKI